MTPHLRSLWPKLALAMLLATPSASAQSLKEAVEAAVNFNPEVLAVASRRQASGADVDVARGGYFPRVDVTASYGRENLDNTVSRALGHSEHTLERRNASLAIAQLLFDGGAVSGTVSRQQARYASVGHRLAATTEDVALRAVAAYLDVLHRRDTVKIAEENLRSHERIFELIRQRTSSGVGRRADAAQADSRLAFAQSSLETERGNLRDASIAYVKVIGRNPATLERPAPPIERLPPLADGLDRALTTNPLVRAAQADLASARAEREVARAALFPRVDVELASSRDRSKVLGSIQDNSAAVVLRYNLFRGGADDAQIRSSTFAIEESRQQLARTQREVEQSVSLAYSAFATAQSRNESLRRFVGSAEETRKAYAVQFTIGQRTLLDLLNAESEHFNAQLALVQGQYAESAQIYRALAAIGTLVNTLAVSMTCCSASSHAPVEPGERRVSEGSPDWMLRAP